MFLGTELLSGRLWSEVEISLGLMTCVSWLTVRRGEYIECGEVAGCRLIERCIGCLVVMLSMCMWKLNKHSMSEADHSW